MSAASELLRLGDRAAEAIPLAVANCITKEEARQIVQLHKRSGQSVSDCVHQSLLTRPKIERLELILGGLLSPDAQKQAESLGNDGASKLLARRLAQSFPRVFFRSVRVNADRFSLMLEASAAGQLRDQIAPLSVESRVTELLEQPVKHP